MLQPSGDFAGEKPARAPTVVITATSFRRIQHMTRALMHADQWACILQLHACFSLSFDTSFAYTWLFINEQTWQMPAIPHHTLARLSSGHGSSGTAAPTFRFRIR